MKAGFLGGQRRSTRATRVRVRDAPAADDDDDDDVPPPLVRDSDGSDDDDDAASDDGPPSLVEFRGSGSDSDYSTVSGESPPPLVDDDEEFDSDADVSDPDESGDGRARARGARVNGPGAGSAASRSSKSIERDGSYYCTWKIPGVRQGMDNPTRQQYHTQYVDVGEMWDNLGGRWDDDTDKNNELAGLQPVQQRARLILYPSGDSASRRGWASCYLQMKQFQRVRTDGGDEWVEHNKGGMFFSNFAHYYVAPTQGLRDDEIPGFWEELPPAFYTYHRFNMNRRSHGWADWCQEAKLREHLDPDGALWVTAKITILKERSQLFPDDRGRGVGGVGGEVGSGKFTWHIENMDSFLGMMKQHKVTSPEFRCGVSDMPFCVSVYETDPMDKSGSNLGPADASSKGLGIDPNEKVSQLSICLEVADAYTKERRISFTDTTWLLFRVTLHHIFDSKASIHRDTYGRMARNNPMGDDESLGFRAFIPMEDFVESGYLGLREKENNTSITVTFLALREASEAKTSSWYALPSQCRDPVLAAASQKPGGPSVGAQLSVGKPSTAPGSFTVTHAPVVKGIAGGIPDEPRTAIKGKRPKGQRPQDNTDNGRMQCVGRFVWRIDKFSKLKDIVKKRKISNLSIKSPQFTVGGYSMRLIMYPRGMTNDSQDKPPTHMAVFLQVSPGRGHVGTGMFSYRYRESDNLQLCNNSDDFVSSGWSCFVSHKLGLLNQKDPSKSISHNDQKRHSYEQSKWGYEEFVHLTRVFDDKEGFLVDDSLVLTVETLVMAESGEATPGPRLWTPPRALWHFDPLTPKGRASRILNAELVKVFDWMGVKSAPDDEHYLNLDATLKEALEECRVEYPDDPMFSWTWDPTICDPEKVYPDWEYAAKDGFFSVNAARSCFAMCCQLDWMDAEGMLNGERPVPTSETPRLWTLFGIALRWDEASANPPESWRLSNQFHELLTDFMEAFRDMFAKIDQSVDQYKLAGFMDVFYDRENTKDGDAIQTNKWLCFFRMLRIMSLQYLAFQFPDRKIRSRVISELRTPGAPALPPVFYERKEAFVVHKDGMQLCVLDYPNLMFFFRWHPRTAYITHYPFGCMAMDFSWKIDNFTIFRDVIEQERVFTNVINYKNLVDLELFMLANNGQLRFIIKAKPGRGYSHQISSAIVSYRIAVMNAKQPTKTVWLTGKLTTNDQDAELEYMPLTTLLDRESGFLQKESITVQMCMVDLLLHSGTTSSSPATALAAPAEKATCLGGLDESRRYLRDNSETWHRMGEHEQRQVLMESLDGAFAASSIAPLLKGIPSEARARFIKEAKEHIGDRIREIGVDGLGDRFREIGIDGIDNMEQYTEQLGDMTKFLEHKLSDIHNAPDEIRPRLNLNMNEALQALKALDGISACKTGPAQERIEKLRSLFIEIRKDLAKAANEEGPASAPNAAVSGEEEKKFLEILGRHTLEMNPEDPVSLAFPGQKVRLSLPWIWDEPNPHEKLTHPAWNTPDDAVVSETLASSSTPTQDACMLLYSVPHEWIRDWHLFPEIRANPNPDEHRRDVDESNHRIAFRQLVATNPKAKKDIVLILHKLFRDSYTIWQIFGGGAAFIESLDYAFLDRDYYNDARIGRHDIAVPAAGETAEPPNNWRSYRKLLQILEVYMSVECLRGFIFWRVLRAMKEMWHLSTHQFFPKNGEWPKDRTLPADFDYASHAVNPEAFWPDHAEFAKSEGIFEGLVYSIVTMLVRAHELETADHLDEAGGYIGDHYPLEKLEWTESPPDEQFEEALDKCVGFGILCEIARLGIHLKHLQVKQKNPRTKINEFVADVCPSPAHLVFHKIVFHLPKLTPNTPVWHTELMKMLMGLANASPEVIERQCRYLDLIAGVGLDDHDSDTAEKLRGRGCGRLILIDPDWWRNTAFLGELTEHTVNEKYWTNARTTADQKKDDQFHASTKMEHFIRYLYPLMPDDTRHHITKPEFGTLRPEHVQRIRGVYFEAMRRLVLDERSGDYLADNLCDFVSECKYPTSELDAALAACLEVKQSFDNDKKNILRIRKMLIIGACHQESAHWYWQLVGESHWNKVGLLKQEPDRHPRAGKLVRWLLQQAMARNPAAASEFVNDAFMKIDSYEVAKVAPWEICMLPEIDLPLLFECCRYVGVRDPKFPLTDDDAKAFPFHRIYEKAIAALNAGMKEPEDQNPEVRYTGGGFWFQPSVIRHELREWLLQSLQTLRTPWREDHPDLPDKNLFRASGPLVDDNYASVGRSNRTKCRTDCPQFAAAAGHERLDSDFITTVMSVAELCLRDKDGTPRRQSQRVDDTERGYNPKSRQGRRSIHSRSFASMSRSARGVFNFSRIDLDNELQEMEWVHYYGVYKDLFEIYGNPSMMRGDSPLPLMCDQRMKDPFVVYQVGDMDFNDPEVVKLEIINILCSKFRDLSSAELGSGLSTKFLPDVRGLAMLLLGEPFVDLRQGFHYRADTIGDPITDEDSVNYGHRYEYEGVMKQDALHCHLDEIAPSDWLALFGHNPVLNKMVFALAALCSRLGASESEMRRLKHSLSMNQEKLDKTNASIAEKAAELGKETKKMQAKVIEQEKKLEKAVANHNNDIASLTAEKKKAEAILRTAQSQLEILRTDSDKNTKEWLKKEKEFERRSKELQVQVTKLKKEKASEQQAQELKTANQRVAAAQAETRKKEQELVDARTAAAKFEREAEEATAANRNLTEKVKELKAELKGAQQAATRAQREADAKASQQTAPDPNPILQQKAKELHELEREMKKLQVEFAKERKRMNWLCGNKMQETSEDDLEQLQQVHRAGLIALADEWHRRRLPFDAWVFRDDLPEPYFPKQPPRREPQQQQPAQQPAAAAATTVVGSITGTQYQTSLRPNPFQSQADRGLGPATVPIGGGGSGPSSAVGSPARGAAVGAVTISARMASMERAQTGTHGGGFFGSVVGAATDDDALEPGMTSTSAGDDVDIGGGAGATGGSGSGSDGFLESSGFPRGSRFQGLGNGTWSGVNSTWR